MAKTPSDHLLFSLEELVPYDFEKFKFKLQNTSLEKEQPRIPRGLLQMAGPVKVASLLINHYGEEYALRLTMQVLRAINQRLLAEELLRAAGQECPLQEGVTDSSATSCSSGETKPKSLKIPDGPESSGQQQRGNGSPSLLSSQPEAEKGSQKRYPGKRREEKGSEGPEGQGKQGARGTTRISRRNIFLSPGRVPWEKEKESPRLRRNAFSSSGLSELSIRSFSGSLGRTAIRKSETHLPSGKKRPKSLEFAIPSGERGPPNSETLLMQDGTRISPDSTAIPRKVATLYVEATVAPEQGSRNPEVAVTLEGLAFKNTLDNASQTGEKTWGHTESTDHSKENGIGSPEAPVPLGEMVDSALHGPANPQVFPSLGRKGSQNPEDPPSLQITAYEGGHSSSCPLYQAPLPRQCSKSREQPKDPQVASLGSDPPPQCERHMKQPRLLFCEDHREAVCLICSLSQEHRGHQVRPIEEVAFECKEQIKRQLEHLKDLKKYGEEQKSEGDKETANFLKQIETQKQRVQGQLEQLCRFLEEQQQHFVAWLEALGQSICQVGGAYGTRVSQDIAFLDELIGGLEAKQCQLAWELMQDIGDTLHRAKTVAVPESWATPPEVKEKLHLLYRRSESVEKSMKNFSETLRLEMGTFHDEPGGAVSELTGAQAHAVNVTLDAETAHPNLIFSNDLKSVRLGNKEKQLPRGSERFDSCIMALGSQTFLSGRQYWEVEVGDKTGWVLGVCEASISKKGNMALSPENGYWVVIMTKEKEYQASTLPPTRLRLREPPKRVGVFLNCEAGDISFYNVMAKSHIYTFTCSSSGPLQPIFSPGAHDGRKNREPLIICPVGGREPH
ncbi:pyrin isoform X2 [Choloepus didactylus]|uniref:pyrin isoform X2 n=1 Tax=Choloepus didactylus TaxID=27675 RepID=UPI00189FABF5|nr:pyrin isoform X2 [Choloepus didactylus]